MQGWRATKRSYKKNKKKKIKSKQETLFRKKLEIKGVY